MTDNQCLVPLSYTFLHWHPKRMNLSCLTLERKIKCYGRQRQGHSALLLKVVSHTLNRMRLKALCKKLVLLKATGWILPFLWSSNRIYRPVFYQVSITSWRLGFSFSFVWAGSFWSTTLLTLSISCGDLILFWSPTWVAGSTVLSEGIFLSICSCNFIDWVCPSASLNAVTTFHFLHNTSWHANSR